MNKKFPLFYKDAEQRKLALYDAFGKCHIDYKLLLIYRKQGQENKYSPETSFDGKVDIAFYLEALPDEMFLDYDMKIHSMKINDNISEIVTKENKLILAGSMLKSKCVNTISILFSSYYRKTCTGICHF
jgi:CCR4-NOT transcriptional regulation complex NOT5 subunit